MPFGLGIVRENAAELAENYDYLAAIDVIAQEQVWLDGGDDNDPPGDYPLSRTDAEVNTRPTATASPHHAANSTTSTPTVRSTSAAGNT